MEGRRFNFSSFSDPYGLASDHTYADCLLLRFLGTERK